MYNARQGDIMILLNPVLISVVIMCVLCLFRFNVLLAILVSSGVASLVAYFDPSGFMSSVVTKDGSSFITGSVNLFIIGMRGNLQTALSYILLGALAAAISRTNLTAILINAVGNFISKKSGWLVLVIASISCFSQNLIPVHIAFIPILIPPLLAIMNKLKIDRRAVACALTFGLQAPYVALPAGFGLIFYGVIADQFKSSNIEISVLDVSKVMWLGGVAMLVGLLCAMFFYRKPREYKDTKIDSTLSENKFNLSMGKREWSVLIGGVIAFIVQLLSDSLPLGALCGLIFMIITGGIEYKNIDKVMEQGLAMMAFIAFVMLVAAGFAEIMKATGGIAQLVAAVDSLGIGKFGSALIMLIVGLIITIGIGTSFGTTPIIAAIYIPLCSSLGFSIPATILLIGIAAAVGDAGSPASDSTLGPTSGLNADGQHNHIYDTCIPTFLFFNIPLIIFGAVFAMYI